MFAFYIPLLLGTSNKSQGFSAACEMNLIVQRRNIEPVSPKAGPGRVKFDLQFQKFFYDGL
jgi:hypothetical protein